MNSAAIVKLLRHYGFEPERSLHQGEDGHTLLDAAACLRSGFTCGKFDGVVAHYRLDNGQPHQVGLWLDTDDRWRLYDGRRDVVLSFAANPGSWMAERLFGAHPNPQKRVLEVFWLTQPVDFDTEQHMAAWVALLGQS